MRIHLFVPCFLDQLAPSVAWATVRVLESLGHELVVPEKQGCCGQPALNSGFHHQGVDVARAWLQAFDDAETIVAPSGSCVGLVRNHYPGLFAESGDEAAANRAASITWELSEFLVDVLGVDDVGARYEATACYHDGCHGLREIGLGAQARQLLSKVRGLTLVESHRPDLCCGFGGSFAVKLPELSVAMADAKLADLRDSGAQLLVSGEFTCLLQLRGRLQKKSEAMPTLHLAELLASGLQRGRP